MSASKPDGELPENDSSASVPGDALRTEAPHPLKPLLLSVLLTGCLAIAVLLALTPYYETNDDVGMNASVAWRLGFSQPDEHLLFSNVLIGLALKKCYAVWPGVPWYVGYLFLTAALSLAALSLILRCRQSPARGAMRPSVPAAPDHKPLSRRRLCKWPRRRGSPRKTMSQRRGPRVLGMATKKFM